MNKLSDILQMTFSNAFLHFDSDVNAFSLQWYNCKKINIGSGIGNYSLNNNNINNNNNNNKKVWRPSQVYNWNPCTNKTVFSLKMETLCS